MRRESGCAVCLPRCPSSSLVNNALTHGDAHCSVRVRTRGRRDMVALSVHNTGSPIPPDLQPRLFEPLKRGDPKDRPRAPEPEHH